MCRDDELKVALAALRFACKLSTDISCKINQELDSRPAPGAPTGPLTPKSNSHPQSHADTHDHDPDPYTANGHDARRDSRNGSGARRGESGRGRGRDRKASDRGNKNDYSTNDTDHGSVSVIAAPAGATCYSVIVAFAGLERIFPSERVQCRQAIAEKFESLRLFSLRWGIAGM